MITEMDFLDSSITSPSKIASDILFKSRPRFNGFPTISYHLIYYPVLEVL